MNGKHKKRVYTNNMLPSKFLRICRKEFIFSGKNILNVLEKLLYWRLPSDSWFCLKRDEVLFVSALQEFSPNRCYLLRTLHSNCRICRICRSDQHFGASFTPRRRQVKQKSSWQALCLQNLVELVETIRIWRIHSNRQHEIFPDLSTV